MDNYKGGKYACLSDSSVHVVVGILCCQSTLLLLRMVVCQWGEFVVFSVFGQDTSRSFREETR